MPHPVILETKEALLTFAKRPFDEIARLPAWSGKRILFLQLIVATLSGILTPLWAPTFWRIFQGLIFFPIFAVLMNLILTSFFYYYFQIFERRVASFTRLLTLVFFATLPFFLFHIASGLFAIADLFGLAMTAMLLVIGLTENFSVPKKRALRLIGVMFGLLFVLWLLERLSGTAL